MFKIFTVCILLSIPSFGTSNAGAAEGNADPWRSLQFLFGTWEARTQGGTANAAGSGTYTFQLELQNHIVARHSGGEACKGPADFNCEHGDLLYVYSDAPGQPYKAIYFDNEGHVIHYDVSTPSPFRAIFLSDQSRAGPQFRLSYELNGSTMSGKFQIRMPGQAEFKSYLEWSGSRR
ncbi:MAG TPA: hypothetical protein VGI90_15880 [Steroidobacteraceae bacterium]